MRNKIALSFALSLLITSFAVAVDDPFSFTAVSAVPAIPDEDIAVFPLTMSPAYSDILPAPPYPMVLPNTYITSLELVMTGLVHSEAGDLDIYLIDPFGKTLKIMTDRGVGAPINATLIFRDNYVPLPVVDLPPENGPIPFGIPSGTYLPEGVPGFSKYIGGASGTDAWVLVVIDDSPGNTGSLESFTLRGTYVPEPVTLSLLALGALTLLRRRRA